MVDDQLLEVAQRLIGRRLDRVVLYHVGPLGDLRGVTPLVVGEAGKPSGEGVAPVVAGELGAQRDDRGRINPAAQRRSDRDVAPQAKPDRVDQEFAQPGSRSRVIA